MKTVTCCEHGEVNSAFVCRHLVESLDTKTPVGFIWSRDGSEQINAYCNECDEVLKRFGGDWNEDSEAFAGVKLICETCAKNAAGINGVELFQ